VNDATNPFAYLQLPGLEDRDPYTKPTAFLRRIIGTEQLEVVLERRPSEMLLVNKLREAVDEWRDAGYPGASKTTKILFRWWFEEAEVDGLRLYWAQREAIETVAYLVEVVGSRDVLQVIDQFQDVPDPNLLEQGIEFQETPDGVRQVVRRRRSGSEDVIDLPPHGLSRFALKMATGSGKTLVMALVVVWSYFHSRRETNSPLAPNFLVLAPNVIVFERLRVDFQSAKIFHDLPLVPPGWQFDLQVILRGESTEPSGSGNLFLTNIHQLRDVGEPAPKNALDKLLGRKPTGDPNQGRRMLTRIHDLDSLVVLNDEAHHVHDEDLEWHKTLMGLHRRFAGGLSLWLDLSATPKFQSGVYYPWIICDYPLAQAVEDRVVKAPMILRMVERPDPDAVTAANVIDKYRDWLSAGVDRLRAHEKYYKKVGVKPVMFVMCESVKHADKIGAWLKEKSGGGLNDREVLVIHTDSEGEIRKGDLDELREQARLIDDPESPVRVVVSVLVLREGWDVRNVTVVLGLRPGTATARILPEQAIGRGLRLIHHVDPPQVLEVVGTAAFEDFVRGLEHEGLHVPTDTKPPPPPITVAPTAGRLPYDIEIPRTGGMLERIYSRVEDLDVDSLEPVLGAKDVARLKAIRMDVEAGVYGVHLGELTAERPAASLSGDLVAQITNRTQAAAGLTLEFATLVPLVRKYVVEKCFGEPVDLESEPIRVFLSEPSIQERIASYLGSQLGDLVTDLKPLVVEGKPLRLSGTAPFLWRRQHTRCTRTVFNYVATFNNFETDFAEFLDEATDVARFAALAEFATGFWVDYVKPSGATGRYFPDWVVVQNTDDGDVHWIIETKGRVWEGTEQKDAAIRYWCSQVTALSGDPWEYIRVNQSDFKPIHESLRSLIDALHGADDVEPSLVTS
jgi:type III restriction enzyme